MKLYVFADRDARRQWFCHPCPHRQRERRGAARMHRLIIRGRRIDGRVALDLGEVTLMDRMSARFFAEQIQREN